MAITLQDKHKQKPFSLKNLQDSHWPSIWQHIVTQPVFKIACFGCCIVAPIAAITELWGPSFLVAKYGFARLDAASIASASFVGIAIGGPLVGYLVGQNIAARKILLFGLIGAWLSMVLALYVPALPWQILLGLFFMFGLSSSSMLLCFSENALGAPKYMQATIIGITNTIIMAGSGLIQKAVSQLLHYSALNLYYTANDFHLAFLILPLCQMLALALWLSLPKPTLSE